MFTTEWKRFDWFGWGDWLYLITSILAWGQTFFMFNESITDDDGSAFYLVGRLHSKSDFKMFKLMIIFLQ